MTTYVHETTKSVLSKKEPPSAAQTTEQRESARELIALLGRPYHLAVSQNFSKIDRFWEGTFTSPISVPQADAVFSAQLETLQQWYHFRDERTRILRFLESYPFLVPLLIEAYYNIQKFFPYSLVSLTVVTDPEEFGSDQLVAFISTTLGPDEAIDALSAFDKKWWLNSLKRTQGKLCITLEFQ